MLRTVVCSTMLRGPNTAHPPKRIAQSERSRVAHTTGDRVGGSVDVEQPRALRWHAYFWDPWFLLWGCALTVAMIATRTRDPRTYRRGELVGQVGTSR